MNAQTKYSDMKYDGIDVSIKYFHMNYVCMNAWTKYSPAAYTSFWGIQFFFLMDSVSLVIADD